ncbi:MAG: hypothetical protein KatS3mg022_0636 [Armatimonadota bacterium]|nr:MAG: hypothetical protein KatS3mg022_0636 [Armatimonadota bacterium]
MEQAKSDLEHARKSINVGDYDWACFAAQQAAGKAMKALHMRRGAIVWGHSVLDLLEALEGEYDMEPDGWTGITSPRAIPTRIRQDHRIDIIRNPKRSRQ